MIAVEFQTTPLHYSYNIIRIKLLLRSRAKGSQNTLSRVYAYLSQSFRRNTDLYIVLLIVEGVITQTRRRWLDAQPTQHKNTRQLVTQATHDVFTSRAVIMLRELRNRAL